MSNAHDFTSTVKEHWTIYMEETENHFLEDTAAVEIGRCCLEDGLQDWYGLNAKALLSLHHHFLSFLFFLSQHILTYFKLIIQHDESKIGFSTMDKCSRFTTEPWRKKCIIGRFSRQVS